ncbi:hypothetical protein [Paraburkholderia aspalathi]|uniref:hypothetical protein n=1 Tax=Paraburkholderia aspalathi TaxID=1324617 RepID=UPI001BA961DF|nr:hypothetical protein [Paraburkholderia aspalathi]
MRDGFLGALPGQRNRVFAAGPDPDMNPSEPIPSMRDLRGKFQELGHGPVFGRL